MADVITREQFKELYKDDLAAMIKDWDETPESFVGGCITNAEISIKVVPPPEEWEGNRGFH